MMDFGEAIRALKDGKRVARAGWNGKGMWLVLVELRKGPIEGFVYDVSWPFDGPPIGGTFRSWIGMKAADDSFVPWLASQTDVLAEDWEAVT